MLDGKNVSLNIGMLVGGHWIINAQFLHNGERPGQGEETEKYRGQTSSEGFHDGRFKGKAPATGSGQLQQTEQSP